MTFISSVYRFMDYFKWNRRLDHIPFSQFEIRRKLNWKEHRQLIEIDRMYNGLCELICNRVLMDNLLTKGNDSSLLKKQITISKLNEQQILSSHILMIFSIFHKALAFLFGIYPNNVFSCFDQWNLIENSTKSMNRKILKKGLKLIAEEETIKLYVFQRSWSRFSGHSLLIKKMPDNQYSFFDPNTGEERNLSFEQLCDRIDRQLKHHIGTDLFFTKGNTFLQMLQQQ